jgi:hypothetical protein
MVAGEAAGMYWLSAGKENENYERLGMLPATYRNPPAFPEERLLPL